jgi:hypothetical protein
MLLSMAILLLLQSQGGPLQPRERLDALATERAAVVAGDQTAGCVIAITVIAMRVC